MSFMCTSFSEIAMYKIQFKIAFFLAKEHSLRG